MTDWQQLLDQLITTGAELEVLETDGTVRDAVPLARHHRHQGDVLWLRPITGPPHRRRFSHDHAKRRGIRHVDVQTDPTARKVVLATPAGQQITIRPAGDATTPPPRAVGHLPRRHRRRAGRARARPARRGLLVALACTPNSTYG